MKKNAQIFIGNLIKDGYLYDKDDIAEAFYNRLSEKKQPGGIFMI